MDNILSIGNSIYKGTFTSTDKVREFIVYSTYPNKEHKCTVSIIDMLTRQCVDAKTFYDSVAAECIENWILRRFNPDLNVKLEPLNIAMGE